MKERASITMPEDYADMSDSEAQAFNGGANPPLFTPLVGYRSIDKGRYRLNPFIKSPPKKLGFIWEVSGDDEVIEETVSSVSSVGETAVGETAVGETIASETTPVPKRGMGGKMANCAFTALSVAFIAGCILYSGCR